MAEYGGKQRKQLSKVIGDSESKDVQLKRFIDNRPQAISQMNLIRSIQKKPNNTGLPDNLKSRVENLSGYSMDDVKVHYNSRKPAQLNALAYAQGTDIHVAPGQEKHLPHEAWHVVQQKQGRVQPTMQLQGVNVNDNEELEKEADVIESKIIQAKWIKVDEAKYKWDNIIDGVTWYVNINGEFFKEGTKSSAGDKEETDYNEIINSEIRLYEHLLKTRMALSPDDITTFIDIVTVYAQNIHRKIRLKYDNKEIKEPIDSYMQGFGRHKQLNKSAFQLCLNDFFSKPQKNYNELIELCSQIISGQYFSEGNNRTTYGIMILLGRIYDIQIPPADIVLSRPKIIPSKTNITEQFKEMLPPFF